MFTRVLLAVDDSPQTSAAVEAVVKLAAGDQAAGDVHVLHVLEHGPGRAAAYDLESADDVQVIVTSATTDLDRAGVRSTGEHTECLAGDVGRTIAESAARLDCDLVVVGSRGLSDLGAAVMGSVAHDVIRHFDGCVLVAR